MSETYYAGAYWGQRPESVEECARRAETFFRLLARCDPTYARWYEKHNSVQRALQLQFEPTFDTFRHFFATKKYQVDDDGFRFGSWTGHVEEDQGGMVMLRCGSDAAEAPNSALLYFPSEGTELARLLSLPVLTEVMRAMVLAWDPDWAVVTSHELRDSLSQDGIVGTFVGWVTYFSRERGEVPDLPKPVRVEPVEDKGTIVVLRPERFMVANPEHLAQSKRIHTILAERGMLRSVLRTTKAGVS